MKTRNRSLLVGISAATFIALVGCGNPSSPSEDKQPTFIAFFKLDPRATYLHTCTNPTDPYCDDGAQETVPIPVGDYGLAPGDSLLIRVVGDFWCGIEDVDWVIAVFSCSDTLLAPSELHRVPDAIDAGEDFDSGTTWGCGNEPTDIPEDFYCRPEVSVSVPAGATHLFICARDSYYEDNTDDDNDFGVNISKYED